MTKLQIRSSLLLLLTAIIWGSAFTAQSVGMDYVGPFTFNGVRSIIGGVALIPVIGFLNRGKKKEIKSDNKTLIIGGICCGVALAIASSLQQIGIMYTTVGKSGFITTFYIVLVPILGLFFHKKCGLNVWIGVMLALAGLYFLCITETLTIGKGDIYVFLCALVFAVHILIVDYFTYIVEGVKLACLQFLVCGLVCGVLMFAFENPQLSQLLAAWKPLLYAGVLSCGVGYTLQIIGQKGLSPTVASLIMSLESVASVITGFIVLGQALTFREMIGCVLMFAAIILAQIPSKENKQRDVDISAKNV